MNEDQNAKLLSATIAEHEQTILSLKQDNEALRQEFAQASTYEETVEVAKRAIADMLELSITTTKHLIANADSESVRSSLSKFVISTVLEGKLTSDADSSIKDLIKKLADNDTAFKEEAQAMVEAHQTQAKLTETPDTTT